MVQCLQQRVHWTYGAIVPEPRAARLLSGVVQLGVCPVHGDRDLELHGVIHQEAAGLVVQSGQWQELAEAPGAGVLPKNMLQTFSTSKHGGVSKASPLSELASDSANPIAAYAAS